MLLDVAAVRAPDANAGVDAFERTVAQMRPDLPNAGAVGYFTDGSPGGETMALAEFNLVQYAIAPAILVNRLDRKFVIANLHGRAAPPRNFVLVRDYGSGIELLRNPSQ